MFPYKVSIIVPAYNEEKNIDKILQNIFSQTYKNIEVIVVDDGSQDDTKSVCGRYKKYSNFRYIYKSNSGVSESRNLGLEYVTGDFICFCDADDWIEAGYIQNMVNGLKLSPKPKATIVSTGSTVEEFYNGKVSKRKVNVVENALLSKESLKREFVNRHETFGLELWNKLFPKKIVKEIRFNSNFISGEDFEFFTQALSRITYLVTLNSTAYHYKVEVDTIRHPMKFNKEIEREKIIKKNLTQIGISKKEVDNFFFRRLLILAYTRLSFLISEEENISEIKFILKILRDTKPDNFEPFANYQRAQKIMIELEKFQSPFLLKKYFEFKRKVKNIKNKIKKEGK